METKQPPSFSQNDGNLKDGRFIVLAYEFVKDDNSYNLLATISKPGTLQHFTKRVHSITLPRP